MGSGDGCGAMSVVTRRSVGAVGSCAFSMRAAGAGSIRRSEWSHCTGAGARRRAGLRHRRHPRPARPAARCWPPRSRRSSVILPPARPTIVFVGDYVDRGPGLTRGHRLAMRSGPLPEFERVHLRGNHEEWFEDFLGGDISVGPSWLYCGGAADARELRHASAATRRGQPDARLRVQCRRTSRRRCLPPTKPSCAALDLLSRDGRLSLRPCRRQARRAARRAVDRTTSDLDPRRLSAMRPPTTAMSSCTATPS